MALLFHPKSFLLSMPGGSLRHCYITYLLADFEEKMRSKEEVEKMFEATKKELDKIVEADTPRTGLQEDKRLMLSAQLGILSWVLGIEK
jgi:hypothetical protein